MPDPKDSSSLQSLGDAKLGSSGRSANVSNKKNVKQQKWSSDDQALSLLKDINSIIGDEADAEHKRIQADLDRKREEERAAEARAEEDRKRQGEALLAKERQLFDEKERKREEERKAVERQKKIQKGEIDPAKEEAARVAAEEERRRQDLLALSKDQALTDAQSLIRQQQQELRKLSEFSLTPVAAPQVIEVVEPKRSPLPMIIGGVVLVGAIAAAVVLLQPPPEVNAPQQAAEGMLLQTANGALLVKLDATAIAAVDVGVYQGSGESKNKVFEHKADPWKVDAESLIVTTSSTGEVLVAADPKQEGKDRRREHKSDRKDSRKKDSKAGGSQIKGLGGSKAGGFSFNKGD
jgi:hypothetical protein